MLDMVEKPSEPPTSNRISLSLRPQCRSCLSTYLILLPITKTPSISQFYLMMRKKAPIDDNLLNRIVEEQLPENMEFWQNVTIAYQKASKEYWIRNVDDVKRHWVNIASSGSLDVLSEDAQFILLFCQVEQEQEKDVVSRFSDDAFFDGLLNPLPRIENVVSVVILMVMKMMMLWTMDNNGCQRRQRVSRNNST